MKKILILILAVISFAACTQATKPAARNYVLPALQGESYNFTEQIDNKPVVIAFMAGFCGYCKAMLPYVDNLAKQVPASQADVIVAFMDEESQGLLALEPVKQAKNVRIYYNAGELMEEQGITGFPTIMLFRKGKLINTWRGYNPGHVDDILETLRNLK